MPLDTCVLVLSREQFHFHFLGEGSLVDLANLQRSPRHHSSSYAVPAGQMRRG